MTASAAIATVGDFKQFKSGGQFGAWIGLTPRQRSSGGKNNLGRHHKARRHLPAHAAGPGREVVPHDAHKRQDKISSWVIALRARSGWQKAVVALANKNARILWGGDDARSDLRSQPPEPQAHGRLSSSTSLLPLHDVEKKMRWDTTLGRVDGSRLPSAIPAIGPKERVLKLGP